MLKEEGAILFTFIYKINTYTRREQLNNQQKGVGFEVEQDHHFSTSGKTEK